MYSEVQSFVPGTQLFGMFTLFLMAYVAGEVTRLIRLPPLLGMLIVGLVLRNTGFVQFTGKFNRVAAILRHMALFIILTRAGLGLDPKALKSLSFIIMRLAFCPALVEGFTTMFFTHYFLDLPWMWGGVLGAILAAVSPAVVIPCLFALQEKGYGTDKGIPTLVIAAASLDDILSISIYGVMISMIFSPGSDLIMQAVRGPLGVLFGIIFGIVWGVILHYVPHKDHRKLILFRALLLAGGGLMVMYGSDKIGYPGAGPLGCIIAPLVASLGWKHDGWTHGTNPVAKVYSSIWVVFQPILFGLIGAEVDATVLEGRTVCYGVLSLALSLLARIVLSVVIAYGGGLNWKEKIFVAWAWFPKATVQAALGPIPLDKARENGNDEELAHAQKILILAVLAILITAPLGAVLITILGPKLLTRTVDNEMKHINKNDTEMKTESERDLNEF
ncbi:UNVERIFIED_CONTAM: hypothetical protein PYX00_006765 [Menopon gallinae]